MLEINLTNEVEDLYTENYKILLREIKNLSKWRDIPVLRVYLNVNVKINYINIINIREKAMAPYSSTLAWKIPWTEKPGRLQTMGSLRVGHN